MELHDNDARPLQCINFQGRGFLNLPKPELFSVGHSYEATDRHLHSQREAILYVVSTNRTIKLSWLSLRSNRSRTEL